MSKPNALFAKVSDLLGPTYVPVDPHTGLTAAGGSPSDGTGLINAFLALATEALPVTLYFDIGVGCYGSVQGPSTGHWNIDGGGHDCGIFMMEGSNSHGITNEAGRLGSGYPPYNPATTPVTQSCVNVSIKNIFINGNRGNGTTGNSTSGDPRGIDGVCFFSCIDIISGQNIVIENVYMYNSPYFYNRFGNITNLKVTGCTIDGSAVLASNQDGVHIDGPCQFATVTGNLIFDCYDDGIACDAPEGYGGNITDVVIGNNIIWNCTSLFRCYTKAGAGTQFYVYRVAIANNDVYLVNNGYPPAAIYLGNSSGGAVDSISGITVSSTLVAGVGTGTGSPVLLKISDNCGLVKLSNCDVFPSSGDPTVVLFQAGVIVSDLQLDVRIYNPPANVSAIGGTPGSVTIERLYTDIQVSQTSGGSASSILYMIDPTDITVSDWEIGRLNPGLVSALINGSTWTNLPLIRGAGVVGSLFQIPDAQMAEGVLYVSATTPNAGKICIKNTIGVVVPLA